MKRAKYALAPEEGKESKSLPHRQILVRNLLFFSIGYSRRKPGINCVPTNIKILSEYILQ
jgi:hypothetical protein